MNYLAGSSNYYTRAIAGWATEKQAAELQLQVVAPPEQFKTLKKLAQKVSAQTLRTYPQALGLITRKVASGQSAETIRQQL